MTDTMLQCTFNSPARSFRLMSTLTPSAQNANAGVCQLTSGRQNYIAFEVWWSIYYVTSGPPAGFFEVTMQTLDLLCFALN